MEEAGAQGSRLEGRGKGREGMSWRTRGGGGSRGGQSSTQEALEGRGQGRGPGRRGTAGGPEGRGLRPWAWPGWVGVQPPGQTHPVGGRGPGLLLLIALTGYTAKNAWKDDVFFSWSYFSGWLALPFSILAGNLDSGGGWRRLPRGPLPSLQRPPPPASSRHHRDSPVHSTLGFPADLAEMPLEPQTPVPGALLAIRPRTHLSSTLPPFPFPSR